MYTLSNKDKLSLKDWNPLWKKRQNLEQRGGGWTNKSRNMWEETKGTNKKQGDKQNALRGGGVKGALAHRLQLRTAFKIRNGRHWAPKWPTGSIPRFLGVLSNFC